MHIWRKAALTACLLSMGAAAGAADLVIPGVGTLPFISSVTVADGRNSQLEAYLQGKAQTEGFQTSMTAFLFRTLAIPPGMDFFDAKKGIDFPEGLHVYQLRTEDVRGVYTAEVLTLTGKETDFFPKDKKARRFWADAFSGAMSKEDRMELNKWPQTAAGLETRLKDYAQRLPDEEKEDFSVEVLAYQPWTGYHGEDGRSQWRQDVRLLLKKGALSFPLWVNAACIRNDNGTYTVIAILGNHSASRRLSQAVLYGLYRLERSAP